MQQHKATLPGKHTALVDQTWASEHCRWKTFENELQSPKKYIFVVVECSEVMTSKFQNRRVHVVYRDDLSQTDVSQSSDPSKSHTSKLNNSFYVMLACFLWQLDIAEWCQTHVPMLLEMQSKVVMAKRKMEGPEPSFITGGEMRTFLVRVETPLICRSSFLQIMGFTSRNAVYLTLRLQPARATHCWSGIKSKICINKIFSTSIPMQHKYFQS